MKQDNIWQKVSGWQNIIRVIYSLFWLFIMGLAVIYLFKESFVKYFFQDDWYLLNITRITDIKNLINFFIPNSGLIFYRPLGMQLPFFIIQSVFGVNPLPFHIFVFMTHMLNGYLFYIFLKLFIRNSYLCCVGVFMYLTSTTHMVIFVWPAAIAFVLAPLFYLSSFLTYVKNKILFSTVIFILSLFINELMITLPVMFVFYDLLILKKIRIKRYIIPLTSIPVYIFFKLSYLNINQNSSYVFIGSIEQFARNIRIYLLWAFNWPDEIYGQFTNFLNLNPLFVREFSDYINIFYMNTISIISFFVFLPAFFTIVHKKINFISERKYLFGIFWFFVSLSPVLFFAKHSYTYHMPISLFGLFLFFISFFEITSKEIKSKTLSILISLLVVNIWYFSALKNIQLNQLINWVWHRGDLSYELTQSMLIKYPIIPDNSIIIISESKNIKENRWALGEQSAYQYLYKNPTIRTFYGTTDELLENMTINEFSKFVRSKRLYSPIYNDVGTDLLKQYQALHPEILL